MHKLSEKLTVVFRTKKINDSQLALDKQHLVFFPAMEACREREIESYIKANNSLREVQIQQGNLVPIPLINRDSIDLSEWRMLKTMDGCGSELNAIMKTIIHSRGEIEDTDEHDLIDSDGEDEDVDEVDIETQQETPAEIAWDDKMIELLPLYCTILKLMSEATMMIQAHDVSKLHPFLKKLLNDIEDSLMEGRDESEIPFYMPLFQELLKRHNIDAQSQRTFFWVICNFERKLYKAAADSNLRGAYVKAGAGSFNVRHFLSHWAGYHQDYISEDDICYLEKWFPTLLEICLTHGTIHPEFVPILLQKFIYGKHVEALSDVALNVLAEEQLKKPVSSRPINCFGSTILTNDVFLKAMADRRLKRQIDAEIVENNKADAETQRAIKRAELTLTRETNESKRIALVNKRMCSAQVVYQHYKSDVLKSREEEDFTESISLKSESIKCAFIIFCDHVALKKEDPTIAQSKKKMIEHIRECFRLEPPDLKIFEENNAANADL
jgi:hypothetical protein